MFPNLKVESSIFAAGLICLLPLSASAQIATDGSTSTTVTTNGDRTVIEDGDRAGGNLFHSFRDFSVSNGNEAFFNNDADIANIFSRVTGGNISNIDGLLRANDANLFLINPAGIIFGAGARLDLGGGSFYGSSADSILFDDGEFSATDLENPLLTINAPIGLSFRDNPAPIEVNGSSLTVAPGQNLALLGGNVNFIDSARIFAPGANIELGGLSETGTIDLDGDFKPNFPDNVAKADVSLTETTIINVEGDEGGSITINAGNLELLAESGLIAGIAANGGSAEAQAGDIIINAENNIILEDGSSIRDRVGNNGSGNSGNIAIDTASLTLNNSIISSETSGQGNSGDITINASDAVVLNQSIIRNQVNPDGIGDAGSIEISANTFEATGEDPDNRSDVISRTQGTGNAASINLDIEQGVTLETSSILSQVDVEGVGNSGDIIIDAGSLTMRDAARIQASTKAQGNAGNIIINTAGDINSDNNNSSNNLILSQVLSGAEGDAGNIEITAGGSLVLDNTFIIADSKDRGSSGDITINVAETITLRGDAPVREDGLTILPSAIITGLDEERDGEPGNRVLRSSGQGRAGDINVSARELIVRDLGFLSSSTEDTTIGDAGSVTVNVDKLSITDNGSIGSFTENTTEGKFDAGSINVNARIVELLRGGKIIVATDGDGDAGNINLNVSESLTIDGSGEPSLFSDLVALDEPLIRELQGETGLFAQASQRATGDGGNINIGAGEITPDGDGFNFEIAQPTGEVNVLNQGIITADSQGTGSGGQIFIRAENLALNNQGEIAAVTKFSQDEETEDASQNIVLRIGDTLTLDNNSLISARAFNDANGGNIDLAAKFIIANSSDGDGNDIIASAEQGSGGNIDIATIAIFGLQEREANQGNNTNDIDVSSDFGTDGSVSIESPDVESIQIELPSNIIEPDNYVAQVCAADSIAANSSFVIKGKGGIPPLPTEALSSDSLIIDGKLSALESENQAQNSPKTQYQAIATDEGNIYPARGVIVREDGTVTLTAYPIPDDTQRTLVASRNCQANH